MSIEFAEEQRRDPGSSMLIFPYGPGSSESAEWRQYPACPIGNCHIICPMGSHEKAWDNAVVEQLYPNQAIVSNGCDMLGRIFCKAIEAEPSKGVPCGSLADRLAARVLDTCSFFHAIEVWLPGESGLRVDDSSLRNRVVGGHRSMPRRSSSENSRKCNRES